MLIYNLGFVDQSGSDGGKETTGDGEVKGMGGQVFMGVAYSCLCRQQADEPANQTLRISDFLVRFETARPRFEEAW